MTYCHGVCVMCPTPQAIRVLGLLGALDPYKHKVNIGMIDQSRDASAVSLSESKSSQDSGMPFNAVTNLCVGSTFYCVLNKWFVKYCIGLFLEKKLVTLNSQQMESLFCSLTPTSWTLPKFSLIVIYTWVQWAHFSLPIYVYFNTPANHRTCYHNRLCLDIHLKIYISMTHAGYRALAIANLLWMAIKVIKNITCDRAVNILV